MDHSNQPRQRDIVYCHQCNNEWYRDEHGLTCPECQSDFTEIVEPQDDPRNDDMRVPDDISPAQPPQTGAGEFYAPDPDEEDIDNLQWTPNGPGRMRLQGTINRTITPEQWRQSQQQGGGGLMGLLGGLLQSAIGGGQQQPPQPELHQGQERAPPVPANRPSSAPGSPQMTNNGGNSIRHFQGPGYSMTIATSSSGNLFPRNANGPQPFQNQPESMEQMMAQMFMNIGAVPPGMRNQVHGGGIRMGPGGMMFMDDPFGGPAPGFPGPGGGVGIGPFGNLFQMLGMGGPGGAHGDYVFSQEALDRIVTQMMEQQQMGNAPGPASDAAIKALPTKNISKTDMGENGKAECSICMDEVGLGTQVTILPCGHWFHYECVKAWLSEHDSCPQCRQGIMPKDEPNTDRPRQPTQAPAVDMHSPEYLRSQVPGAFPFPRQNSVGSGDGTPMNPYNVPGSPTLNRRNSTGEQRQPSRQGSSSGAGMFSRMRDVFGSGSGGSNSGDTESSRR